MEISILIPSSTDIGFESMDTLLALNMIMWIVLQSALSTWSMVCGQKEFMFHCGV